MQTRYNKFNNKRRIKGIEPDQAEELASLAATVKYGGNPEHKRNPGDFGLTPPSAPRSGKSLCDAVQIFSKSTALDLLQQGIRKGLVSDRFEGKWPKNIWSVTPDGTPLEAQLENPDTGSYHGYPMPQSDPFAAEVIAKWSNDND